MVEICPHGSFPIKRALDVMGLIGNHLSDSDNKIAKPFGCRPVVTYADNGRLYVRVEDRREHPAGRRSSRIGSRKFDLHFMVIAIYDFLTPQTFNTANAVGYDIPFGRISIGLLKMN